MELVPQLRWGLTSCQPNNLGDRCPHQTEMVSTPMTWSQYVFVIGAEWELLSLVVVILQFKLSFEIRFRHLVLGWKRPRDAKQMIDISVDREWHVLCGVAGKCSSWPCYHEPPTAPEEAHRMPFRESSDSTSLGSNYAVSGTPASTLLYSHFFEAYHFIMLE